MLRFAQGNAHTLVGVRKAVCAGESPACESLPVTVVRFHAPGDVRIEDAPPPRPGPDDVLIRVRTAVICATDVKILRYGHHRLAPPRVIGHEVAGEVVSGGIGSQPGERVQVIAAIPCGQCLDCHRGRMTVCLNQESMGYQYDGGFADQMVVPGRRSRSVG